MKEPVRDSLSTPMGASSEMPKSLLRVLPLLAAILCLRAVLAAPCLAQNPNGTQDVPVVAAARVERGDIFREASFDAELRPYHEVELHARVSGYLDVMKVMPATR